MSYNVHELAKLAGISVRALHYYDEIDLLKPARLMKNGYRVYEEPQLLRLQQILFFRELDFPLTEIKKILESDKFDVKTALRDQKALIQIKQKRLTDLIKTINKTINKLNKKINMADKDLYAGLSDEEAKAYAEEAKQRWGQTEAYRQSQERVKKMTKEDWSRYQKANGEMMLKFVASMSQGHDSPEAQAAIALHYNSLRMFYEPNLEMYKGLAEMYVADPRFTAYYEKYAPGLAKFMRDAMLFFAAKQGK